MFFVVVFKLDISTAKYQKELLIFYASYFKTSIIHLNIFLVVKPVEPDFGHFL